MRWIAALVLPLCMAMPARSFDGTIDVLAASGDPIPGTPETFVEFRTTAINAGGDVAAEVFVAERNVGIVDGYPDYAIVVFRGGIPEIVTREGRHAPGTPAGVRFLSLTWPRLDDAGRVVFQGRLIGPGVTAANELGTWRADADGNVELLARSGDVLPGTTEPLGHFHVATNADGHVAVRQDDLAIWRGPAEGPLALVARVGDAAPDTGATFTWLGFPRAGQASFDAGLGEADEGIYAPDESGAPQLVARVGETAPGTALPFHQVVFGDANHTGEVAFWGTLDVAGTLDGVWGPASSGPVSTLARVDDPAPGAPGASTFNGFSTSVSLDDAGRTTFRAGFHQEGVPGSSGAGLWRSDGSTGLDLVVRLGDPLPDGSGRWTTDAYSITAGGSGDLAFVTPTYGPDPVDRVALLAVDPNGTSQVVMKTGDALAVAPGDARVVASMGPASDSAAGARGLNGARQMPLIVYLADESQALTLVTLPEPAHALLLAVGALALAAARRRS